MILRVFITFLLLCFLPLSSFAGLHEDLNGNLIKPGISYKYNKKSAVFNIYFDLNLIDKYKGAAALMAIRYIFESNQAKPPKKIVLYNMRTGVKIDTYTFDELPSLQ